MLIQKMVISRFVILTVYVRVMVSTARDCAYIGNLIDVIWQFAGSGERPL